MGATQGTLSYQVFYIKEKLPKDIRGTFLPLIKEHVFVPLNPEDEEDDGYGWVPLDSPFCYEFTTENVFMNSFLNLSLRYDKYVLPGQTFSARCEQVAEEFKKEHKKESLSKSEMEEIKAHIKTEMKTQMFPRMVTIDMSWDLTQNRIRFWNQSPRMCGLFYDFFQKTFGIEPFIACPYNTVMAAGFPKEDVEILLGLHPAQFTDGVPNVDF